LSNPQATELDVLRIRLCFVKLNMAVLPNSLLFGYAVFSELWRFLTCNLQARGGPVLRYFRHI
jgi:hypothetical protein